MDTKQLAALANEASRRWPDAILVPNQRANLNVISSGTWVAHLDLQSGTIHTYPGDPIDCDPYPVFAWCRCQTVSSDQ